MKEWEKAISIPRVNHNDQKQWIPVKDTETQLQSIKTTWQDPKKTRVYKMLPK